MAKSICQIKVDTHLKVQSSNPARGMITMSTQEEIPDEANKKKKISQRIVRQHNFRSSPSFSTKKGIQINLLIC